MLQALAHLQNLWLDMSALEVYVTTAGRRRHPLPAKRSKVGPLLLPISLAKRASMVASTSISFFFGLGRSLPTFCSGQVARRRSSLSRPSAMTLTDRPGKNDWHVTSVINGAAKPTKAATGSPFGLRHSWPPLEPNSTNGSHPEPASAWKRP